MSYASIFRIHGQCVSVVALLVNLILIYLIRKRSPPEMGAFRYLLYVTCGNDILCCVTSMLTEPVILVDAENYMAVPIGLAQHYGSKTAVALIAIWGFFEIASFLMTVVSVIYRYIAVCRREFQINRIRLIVWLLLIATVADLLFVVCYTYSIVDHWQKYSDTTDDDRMEQFNLVADQFLDIGYPVRNFFFAKMYNFSFDTMPIYLLILFNISYCFVIVFCYRINRFVKVNMTSMHTKRIHSQVTRLLVSMALAPCFAILLPCSILFISSFLRAKLGAVAILCSMGLAWLPLANPVLTIVFVDAYNAPFRRNRNKFASQPTALGNGEINRSTVRSPASTIY